MAKKVEEQKKYTVNEICNELKLIGNDRQYIHFKYSDNLFTYDEWLKNFKNDGLTLLL